MKHILFAICFSLALFASCLDDSSVYDYDKLDAPEWNESVISNEFRVGEMAKFKGSSYIRWNGDSARRASEVRYEWTYGDEVISTEADFEISTNELMSKIGIKNITTSTYYGLFKVIEEKSGITYSIPFAFKLLSTYASKDWLVISEKGSNTELSYIRRHYDADTRKISFILTRDVYRAANGEDIAGKPLYVVRSEGSTHIGSLGTTTIFTSANVYEIDNSSFMKVGHLEEAPCTPVLRTDLYSLSAKSYENLDRYGQHTFVTDENGQMYRCLMATNNLGGRFETTPMVLDGKGYNITFLGLQRQGFLEQPCWDALNRRFVYIQPYESGEVDDSFPWWPQPVGEQYKLSKLVAPAPAFGNEDAIAQKCAPVWNMPKGTEVLFIANLGTSGMPFAPNQLWAMVYNDVAGNTKLTVFAVNAQGVVVDDMSNLKDIPFPGGNLNKESCFLASSYTSEPYYNKMNFLVYSKGNEIRWLDKSKGFQDNSYITLPEPGDKVTYMGWSACYYYRYLVVGTEKGKLYFYNAEIDNNYVGTNPLLPNPKIFAEFDFGSRITSAKEFDNDNTSPVREKY